jgi:hypothetical protein
VNQLLRPSKRDITQPFHNFVGIDLVFKSKAVQYHWVYADGVLVGHSEMYNEVLTSYLPRTTRLIAVEVCNGNYSVPNGLIGSVSNSNESVLTDITWKCSHNIDANWTLLDFNDSHWPYASAEKRGGKVRGVSANASWIWGGIRSETVSKEGCQNFFYCRKSLTAYTYL